VFQVPSRCRRYCSSGFAWKCITDYQNCTVVWKTSTSLIPYTDSKESLTRCRIRRFVVWRRWSTEMRTRGARAPSCGWPVRRNARQENSFAKTGWKGQEKKIKLEIHIK